MLVINGGVYMYFHKWKREKSSIVHISFLKDASISTPKINGWEPKNHPCGGMFGPATFSCLRDTVRPMLEIPYQNALFSRKVGLPIFNT